MKDRALRAQAEAENVRRRASRDVENAHKYALEKFAAALLPVVDSLEAAVQSAETAEDAAAVAEGVQLSLKLFVDTLEKSGVTNDLFRAMAMLGGRIRGGLAVQTLAVAVLLAAMSGIIGGEIVLLGLIALPEIPAGIVGSAQFSPEGNRFAFTLSTPVKPSSPKPV